MPSIDDVLAPDYLEGLQGLSLEQVRARRSECQVVEEALSYERRLIQGRLDIVGAELRRRSGDDAAEPTALVDDLKNILAERNTAPGYGRLSTIMTPALDDKLVAEVEASADASRLAQLAEMDDEAVRGLADDLGQLERQLSEQRRQVHERMDALQAEIVRRYKAGEATVDGLLSS